MDQAVVLAQASYGQTFSGDFTGGEATARRALELAELAEDTAMTVWSLSALSVAVKTQGRYGEALSMSRRAVTSTLETTDDGARLRHPYFFLGMALADCDLVDDARVAFERAIIECEALGSAWRLPDTLLQAANCGSPPANGMTLRSNSKQGSAWPRTAGSASLLRSPRPGRPTERRWSLSRWRRWQRA